MVWDQIHYPCYIFVLFTFRDVKFRMLDHLLYLPFVRLFTYLFPTRKEGPPMLLFCCHPTSYRRRYTVLGEIDSLSPSRRDSYALNWYCTYCPPSVGVSLDPNSQGPFS